MTFATPLPRPQAARVAHPEEWLSMLLCVLGTLIATVLIWNAPSFEPESGPLWQLPVWLALFYLLMQMIFLLFSAAQIRILGVVDSVVAIVPVIASVVLGVEWMLGHLGLSTFQATSLAAFLVAGAAEFTLTLWIRFVLNRRTIAVDQGYN